MSILESIIPVSCCNGSSSCYPYLLLLLILILIIFIISIIYIIIIITYIIIIIANPSLLFYSLFFPIFILAPYKHPHLSFLLSIFFLLLLHLTCTYLSLRRYKETANLFIPQNAMLSPPLTV